MLDINVVEKIFILTSFEPNDADGTDANMHILGVFRKKADAEQFMREYAVGRLEEDDPDLEELYDALDNGVDPVDELYNTYRISLNIETHYLT